MIGEKRKCRDATSPDGASVTWFPEVTATDSSDVDFVDCAPSSGSPFPIGVTTVICTAADLATPPNIGTASFTVTVEDTTPPVFDLPIPTNQTIQATSPAGAIGQLDNETVGPKVEVRSQESGVRMRNAECGMRSAELNRRDTEDVPPSLKFATGVNPRRKPGDQASAGRGSCVATTNLRFPMARTTGCLAGCELTDAPTPQIRSGDGPPHPDVRAPKSLRVAIWGPLLEPPAPAGGYSPANS